MARTYVANMEINVDLRDQEKTREGEERRGEERRGVEWSDLRLTSQYNAHATGR